MSSAPEIVKLFVSSTFEDMHAERDRLNRFVFPEVRERCREIGVDFVAVDLRWGVTRAEAERQEITDLCVGEVDRCRPFFVGLIGDRYGWIPAPERVPLPLYRATAEAADDDLRALLERTYVLHETTGEPSMRLVRHAVADDADRLRVVRVWEAAGLPVAGKSLTEIEIDRALDAAGTHALFYLRDPPVHLHPAFPAALLPVFTSPDGEPQERLARLKARLAEHEGARSYAPRYAGMRVDSSYLPKGLSGPERAMLEDGVFSPEELATLTQRLRRVVERRARVALEGLEAWGDQVAQDLWARIEDDVGARARPEGRGHERFERDRTRLFVGRDDLVQRAVAFAGADARDDLLVFTGPPGSGKSALMAECAAACRREHPDAVVLPHFIGAAPGTTDRRVTIRALCERLRDACGLGDEVPTEAGELEFALAAFLERAGAGRRVVVLLDALDQLDPAGGSHDLRWLPARLPATVRLVVSTLPGAPLDRLRERAAPGRVVELPPLAASDREALIRRTLADRGKKLTAAQIARLLDTGDRPDAVHPLYLLVALEELSVFGDFEGLDRRLAALPPRLPALFDQVIARLELDHGRAPTEASLALLAAARSGLLESEIRDLLADRDVPPLAWSQLRLSLDFYLRPVERDEGLTGFYHEGLRRAVDERYGEAGAAHRELAAYFLAHARRDGGWDASAHRPLAELAFHLVRGGQATELSRVLEDPAFLEARVHAHPAAALLADFDLLLESPGPGIDAQGLGWIRDALRLAAHLLADDPTQVAGQLWARLAPRSSPSVDALRSALREDRHRPWLRPYRARVTAAGSPLRMTLSGMNCVNGVVVSPDDSLALCHDDDGILWLWDLRSGLLRRTIETGRERWINCSARHPARPIAVAGVREGGLLVVDMDAGEIVAELPAADGVEDVAVSPDGREIWTAHESGSIEIRHLDGGPIRTVDVGWDPVGAIVAAAPGRAFVAAGGKVQEWDLETGTWQRTIGEAEGTITRLARSPGGSHLAAGRADGRIDLWDLAGGGHAAPPGHRDREFRNDVAGLAFTRGGALVSGSWDGTVRVWSPSGAPLATLRGHSMAVYALAVLDGGQRAVSASKDGTLRVWDLDAEPVPEPGFAHAGAVDALAARAGIAVSGGRDRRLAVWELGTGRALGHWDAHAGRELHEGWVTAVALDPGGETVHSAGQDGALKTWTADGTLVDAIEGDWGSSGQTALASGVPLLVGDTGGYDDARVSFWRPGRRTRLGRVKVGPSRSAIGVSPDGRIALAADLDGGFAVVDPTARRVLWTQDGREGRRDYAEDVAVGPDGRRAIIGLSNGRVELWDLERRRRRRTFRLHADRAWAVAISPDGALGCSAGWDRVLRVWELETGAVIASYSSDDFWASCIFAGDPRRVLAADERGGLHFLALENLD